VNLLYFYTMPFKKLITVPAELVSFYSRNFADRQTWYFNSDPVNRKLGSGGGTANVIASCFNDSTGGRRFREWLDKERYVIIHSGGQSRRLPAYAATGKSMIPVPVFRWSKGQYLDQKLLDFQASYYSNILRNAPEQYRVLIGSGDVMFISAETPGNFPEADVLCLGLWADDETAIRHGVFLVRRERI
jgi:hypothetical protein